MSTDAPAGRGGRPAAPPAPSFAWRVAGWTPGKRAGAVVGQEMVIVLTSGSVGVRAATVS